MRKKIIFLFLLSFLFTTGFTVQYGVDIDEDKIEESIQINILNSELNEASNGSNINLNIEPDDQITPMLTMDYYPFSNHNEIKYNKEIRDTDSGKMILLNYTYTIKDFVKSRYFSSCYNNNTSSFNNNGYTLNINGRFYCFYGDTIDIRVTTKDKVVNQNAEEIVDNTYIWHVDKNNYNDQNIVLEVEYDHSIPAWIIYGGIGIVGILLIIFILYFIIKNRVNNNI